VAAIRIGNGAASATVTDNVGNAWTLVDRRSDTGGGSADDLELWYAPNASGAPTITVRSSVSASIRAVVAEFSGVQPSAPLDQHAIAIGSGPSPTVSTSASTGQAVELVLGYGEVENFSMFSPSSGYSPVNVVPVGSSAKVALEYRVSSAAAPQTAAFSVTSQAWAMGIATLR
jgi:hypothetical protein